MGSIVMTGKADAQEAVQPCVDAIITAMQAEIQKYGLELLQRYPSDLLVHDRNSLAWTAVPGMEIAWMVGDSHTHMVSLGLHISEAKLCQALTNLANNDRFYKLSVHSGSFTLKELTREAFGLLAATPIKYRMDGVLNSFWLKNAKGENVGHVGAKRVGSWQDLAYEVTITPCAGRRPIDDAALQVWTRQCVNQLAGTLFVKSNTTWAPALQVRQAA